MKSTWVLTEQLGEGRGIGNIPLRDMPFRVGRRSDLSLCLPHPTVSSQHAEFIAVGLSLFLDDLDSTNGTYVNGQRATGRVEVRHGDLIQFADMLFRLSLLASTPVPKPSPCGGSFVGPNRSATV